MRCNTERDPQEPDTLESGFCSQLSVGRDSNAVVCAAHLIGTNQVVVSASGREQTGITYQLAKRIAQYEGVDICGMTTSRIEGTAASTYALLGHLSGHFEPLRRLVYDFTRDPFLTPNGRRFETAAYGELVLIAENRTGLIRDATEVISVTCGANIETLVNRTYGDPNDAILFLANRSGDPLADLTNRGVGFSVTRMKLEFQPGDDPKNLLDTMKSAYPTWDVRWTQRPLTAPGKAVETNRIGRN